MIARTILFCFAYIGYCCCPVRAAAAAASKDETINCNLIGKQCASFDQVKTLADFAQFHDKYSKLSENLRSKKVNQACKEAEDICIENRLLYSNVHSLGHLMKRFQANGESICTMEYSMRLYRLHQQLISVESEREPKRMLRILRSLANRWALRCRSSVKSRLLETEQRAPDAVRHMGFVVNLLYIGLERVALVPLELEHYVPVLEGEELLDERGSSVGRGPSGFEFKLTQQVRVALDGARMSCRALRPYHTNILGSLGLVASLGYGIAPGLGVKTSVEEETVETKGLLRKWLMSAILCQSLGGLMKQAGVTTENKQLLRLKVLPLERPEVSRSSEDDHSFSEMGFDEGSTTVNQVADESAIDSFVYSFSPKAAMRKMQLLTGPSYQLASALHKYLDLTQLEKRFQLPFAILNLPVPKEDPFKHVQADEDEEEEEEEEEEE